MVPVFLLFYGMKCQLSIVPRPVSFSCHLLLLLLLIFNFFVSRAGVYKVDENKSNRFIFNVY